MAAMVKSASENHEQWVELLEMAAGEEERKKNMDLGFHVFYHEGPYGSMIFHLSSQVLNFCI